MALLIIYSLLSAIYGIAYTIHNFRIKNISGAIGTIILILSTGFVAVTIMFLL